MLESFEALKNWKSAIREQATYRLEILVCAGTSCLSSQADTLLEMFTHEIHEYSLDAEVVLTPTGCFGFCGQGPILKIEPDNVTYVQVGADDVKTIVDEHLNAGRIVEHLLYDPPGQKRSTSEAGMPFYQKQHRVALKKCGVIDPENIEHAIKHSAYEALGTVLHTMDSDDVIDIIKQSGLRGRGGGGFPTGLKWQFTSTTQADEKYVVCNADEGDPGAFMDRSIMEGDPHTILEAMTINGYAVGANQGFIYIRAEYELATQRLFKALSDARKHGLLGQNILGSGFDFDIEIKLGAGAFVCGEETALIHSMEGYRGEPTTKPPFPSDVGFRTLPTNVNNVETYANIPSIILEGQRWFQSIGTKNSKGTKVFALAGDVVNIGLVEVPMGITVREIVEDIGGGVDGDKKLKAVQIGGPSGGVITGDDLDLSIDYDSLQSAGAMMGSGGLIVMDDDTDMVEIAKFYLEFTEDESCGKCTPCRIGTKRIHEILHRLTDMEGTPEDLELLEALCNNVKNTSLCGLGQSAPNPVLSTMHHFKNEYEDYAYQRKKTSYSIVADKCIGCTRCKKVCPVDCISGSIKTVHVIDESACIACGACDDACPVDAIIRP